jgi:peptide/nickel transport system substrate-binding protein
MSGSRDQLTRRQVLGAAAGTGAVILAGCGSTGSPKATTTTSAKKAAKPKRGGTFRWGAQDSSTLDSVDPLQAGSETSSAMCQMVYDTLTQVANTSITPVPFLAEEFSAAHDLSYWTFRLREAEFHDGKPVTADDVIFSLKRLLNPKTPGTAAALLPAIDASRLKKLDNRTVRVFLKYPDVSVPDGLTDPGASIVPVDFNPKKPIGSGPFEFQSLSPGVRGVFARNPNYWQSGRPYLDQVEMIGFADPNTTRVNALVSGQIDAANSIDSSLVPTVESASGLNLAFYRATSYITWEMRMDVPPFDDVRVRQAIKLIADRPQMVEQAFSGSRYAFVANDQMADFLDPLYDHSIPQRSQDIEQAKALLKAAGREGLSVPLTVSPITSGVVEAAQVLAQQAKAAGVNIKVNNVQDVTSYESKLASTSVFKIDFGDPISIFNHVGYTLLPSSTYNLSNWRNAKWLSLFNQARGTLDFTKRKEVMDEASRIFWNEGTQAVFAFQNSAFAWNKKFGGVTHTVTGFTPFASLYVV